MFYGNDTEKRKHVEKQIIALREGASMIEFAKQVVRKMDGKVLNVRLKNALNSGEYKYSYYVRTDTLIIECHPKSRQCCDIPIAIVYLDKEDGKQPRIHAKAIIESMDKQFESIVDEAQRLEFALDDIDLIKEKVKKAVDQLNAITDDLPFLIIDTFGLPNKVYTRF